MPRIKSAKKALRQARARTVRNKDQRSALRTAVKRVRIATGDAVLRDVAGRLRAAAPIRTRRAMATTRGAA